MSRPDNRPLLDLVVGARPNFMKLAPVQRAVAEDGALRYRTVHTGQHYDPAMADVFFTELGITPPDVDLGVGSGTHGAQTARILERYEALLLDARPDATVVFGDVNSTVACALAAVKLGIPVVHVEAGLRSFDRTMPEEINRILTDAIADVLFVTEESGMKNLLGEGISADKLHLVGNVMIDTLFAHLPAARAREVFRRFGCAPREYGVVTLHRPANVDTAASLAAWMDLFEELGERLPLLIPLHPRTRKLAEAGDLRVRLRDDNGRVRYLEPLPYLDAISLVSEAAVVLTDSGGLQEETSALRVPCITLRPNTERPVTTTVGTSRLVGNQTDRIREAFDDALSGRWPPGQPVPLWDGHAATRIAAILSERFGVRDGRTT
jgi:UDP-N-acetylglucosamine 2-epimerase (non-hydrolysing)